MTSVEPDRCIFCGSDEYTFEDGLRCQRCAEEQDDCRCQVYCCDSDPDGPGTCKSLPRAPEPPLIDLVLVDRCTGEVIR